MREIFADIPDVIKDLTKMVADAALAQKDPAEAVQILDKFIKQLPPDPKLKEFADFYFIMRMEQMKNDNKSNNDQRQEQFGKRPTSQIYY